jgi:AcrR family transcriptional regulator
VTTAVLARAPQLSARQGEILDALEATFLAEGLDVTVGVLALRARCSRRTLYEIAPSKERLFVLVLDRMLQRIGVNARDAAAAQTTHAGKLHAYLDAADPVLRHVTDRFSCALKTYRPACRTYERHAAIARASLAEFVAAGAAAGTFGRHDPERVADVLIDVAGDPLAIELVVAGLRAP